MKKPTVADVVYYVFLVFLIVTYVWSAYFPRITPEARQRIEDLERRIEAVERRIPA